jgi:hypothetical protein
MTEKEEKEEKEIIRVCGKDYDYWDIPAIIRQRDERKEIKQAEKAEAQMWASE